MQNVGAELQAVCMQLTSRIITAIEKPNLRVEVPTVVIEGPIGRKRTIERLDFGKAHFLDMHEADHDVGDLHAGIVNVILNLDTFISRLEYSHKRVTQHRVSHVPYMCSLAGIDTGMFDHFLWSID